MSGPRRHPQCTRRIQVSGSKHTENLMSMEIYTLELGPSPKNQTKYECPFNSKDDTRHNDRPAPLICRANFLRASLDRASVVTGRVYLFISDVKIRHRGFKMLGAQKNKSRIAFEIFTSFGTEQDSVQAVKITDLTTIAPVATSRTCTTHFVQK